MKKFLALALALVFAMALVACNSGGASSGSEPASAGDSSAASGGDSSTAAGGSLVYGTSADYPPFEFHILEDGADKVVGLDVALARQIAEDQGKDLQIAEMNFDNLLTLMAKGDCDFVIAAMEATEERLGAADASDPYYTDLPAMILVKKERLSEFTSFESFDGLSVGAQSGTTKADVIAEDMPGASPLLVTSVVDLVNNLVYDKCDALVLDGAVAMQYAAANEDLAVIEDEALALGEALPYCVWVAKGDPKGLLPAINETVKKVLADGSMDKFIEEADELSSQALEG